MRRQQATCATLATLHKEVEVVETLKEKDLYQTWFRSAATYNDTHECDRLVGELSRTTIPYDVRRWTI